VAVKVKTVLTRSQAEPLMLSVRPGVEEDNCPQSSWDVWEMVVEAKERRGVWHQWPSLGELATPSISVRPKLLVAVQ
jgi:hypothetical protein